MARSDLLKRLFGAYTKGDDVAFRAVAAEIIDDERRKHHDLLAADLWHALTRDDKRPGGGHQLTMRPLPKDRDDRPLLTLGKPQREMDDLVLPGGVRDVLLELVEENRSRSLLSGFALRPRQRLLFVGSSGTGKSASAHAIASELSLPVATVSLAALVSSYLGETARNVDGVVRFAESTPCVLLFDEFDAIGADRSGGTDHGELRRVVATVLQLLEQMHGESLVIATSNHPSLLDSAVWRRFEEVIPFGSLTTAQRGELMRLKLQAAPHRISVSKWAQRFDDLSAAEVEAVCLDALRRWVLSGSRQLTEDHVRAALDRVMSRVSAISGAVAPRV